MVFEKVDPLPNFPELEQKILGVWKARNVFQRSLEDSAGRPEFVFYEGPPTANGLPHNGHVLTRVMKDIYPRYRTMRGFHVARIAGWDTHGLPVEVEVEKELRIRGKEAILAYGVEAFSRKCLDSVFRYTSEWEHLTERIGFWVDLKEAYVTYHKSYVESVWWALAELFKKGLLYKGHKVVWWWAQGGTALSAGETGSAYKTVNDPSVYVKFPLIGEEAALVVWTTTPWTLSSNMFAAVHGELPYVYAKDDTTGEVLVVAEGLLKSLADKLGHAFTVEKVVQGKDLIGKRYQPPFDIYQKKVSDDPRYFRVVPGDKSAGGPPQWFVTLDAGTGVVHCAPAFGEDDWKVWRNQQKEHGQLELFCAVNPDGKFSEIMGEHQGVWVKDADQPLIRELKHRNLILVAETYSHEYPFCWRSDNDPLIQYAREAWFIKTTSIIDRVIDNNQHVTWLPDHIQNGRYGDFLANNVDWALSRERFWGTPLPIWTCGGCGAMEALSSVSEIESRNPEAFASFRAAKEKEPTLSEDLMVHKPWIDDVTVPCKKCQKTMRRVPEVIDCWFDSGCMPFAQFGYPHAEGSKQAFKAALPADFISEAIDQTRGWFYSLMMVSSLLFPEQKHPHPYKRCIVLGHVSDKYGKKESKSSGNYTPPEIILDRVRMAFAPIAHAKATPEEGTALIGHDDLDGLDVSDGQLVSLYRDDRPGESVQLKLKPTKSLPRRVVVLPEATLKTLGLRLASPDTRPVEVPGLPVDQRVWIEPKGAFAPGADAFRWFFFASNPPWSNTRHSLGNVRGLQKELPIKLRAVYSFFVTYANIDGFNPSADERHRRPTKERPLLDRWVISELETTKKKVVDCLDDFRSFEAAQALSGFVEGLSNWYVRRSRSRFWAEGKSQDKYDAYWTLYGCLRELSLILAPFVPFMAEEMYQNLVVRPYGETATDSVHLASYPNVDQSRIDEGLSRTMGSIRELVSLGLKVRTDNKLKIRQPLASAEIVLADKAMEAELLPHVAVMAEELNVKAVRFAQNADAFVNYKVKPNFSILGKKLGPRMKATQAAIAAAAPNALKAALDSTGKVTLTVEGELLTLGPDELQVLVEQKEGFAAAGAAIGVVSLDTKLTPELVEEGWLREVLSKVQATRKDLDLDYSARIKLSISGDAALVGAIQRREVLLKQEVLAKECVYDQSIGGEKRELVLDEKRLEIELLLLSNKPRAS
ncbi:MAG: isoleucine--tRNA ligase [Myxococcota bacterium]